MEPAEFRAIMKDAIKEAAKEWMAESIEHSASGILKWFARTALTAIVGGGIWLWASLGFPIPTTPHH